MFSRESGPLIKQWPATDMPASLTLNGREYQRYRLTRLVSAREVDEAIIYSTCSFSPAEEIVIFHALFPGLGGVFEIEPPPVA